MSWPGHLCEHLFMRVEQHWVQRRQGRARGGAGPQPLEEERGVEAYLCARIMWGKDDGVALVCHRPASPPPPPGQTNKSKPTNYQTPTHLLVLMEERRRQPQEPPAATVAVPLLPLGQQREQHLEALRRVQRVGEVEKDALQLHVDQQRVRREEPQVRPERGAGHGQGRREAVPGVGLCSRRVVVYVYIQRKNQRAQQQTRIRVRRAIDASSTPRTRTYIGRGELGKAPEGPHALGVGPVGGGAGRGGRFSHSLNRCSPCWTKKCICSLQF